MEGKPTTFVKTDDAKDLSRHDPAKEARKRKIEAGKLDKKRRAKEATEYTTIQVLIGSTVMIDGHEWKIVHLNQRMKRLSISPVENFKAVVPVTDPVKKK